jgi:hypothetical protein
MSRVEYNGEYKCDRTITNLAIFQNKNTLELIYVQIMSSLGPPKGLNHAPCDLQHIYIILFHCCLDFVAKYERDI